MLTRMTLIVPRSMASLLAISLAFAAPAVAQDASYDSTMQITGGTLVDAMQHLSFMKSVKEMLAPTVTTTIVRGNQKAQVSKESIEITDLDKETITRIDNLKKTYTVTTFAQMRQAFANMPAQMDKMQTQVKQAQAQQAQVQAQPGPPQPQFKTSFDVSAKNTGVEKVVNGQNAQEQTVILSVHLTDPNSPLAPGTNPITYTMTTDLWIAPDPPELIAIRAFDMRFGQKLMQGVDMSAMVNEMKEMRTQSQNMGQLFAGQPGAMQAFVQMGEELGKIKGTRIMETTSMGGLAPAPPPGQAAAPSTPSTAGGVAGQVASDTATQTAAGESGKMGVFGNALTNSALNAFHKKPKPAPAATPAPAAAAGTPAGMQQVTLMSTTTQLTNFSPNPGPSSAFQIPAGYKLVIAPTY